MRVGTAMAGWPAFLLQPDVDKLELIGGFKCVGHLLVAGVAALGKR